MKGNCRHDVTALVWYNSFNLHNLLMSSGIMNMYVKACHLFGLHRRKISPNLLIIGTYFFDEYDPARDSFMGNYTCGICRNSISTMLLSNKLRFDDKDLLHGVANPCVAGLYHTLVLDHTRY